MKEIEEHEKYLGLPTFIGRKKRKIFYVVLEWIHKKLKDWKEKTLTKAGREVLLKLLSKPFPLIS